VRVLVTETLSQQGLDLLEKDFQVDVRTELATGDLTDEIAPYDALIIRSATQVTAEVLGAATNLKVVARAGIGLDNVDVEEATRRGVMVVNAPQSNIISAAEQTLALLLAQARNIPQAHADLMHGRWERSKWQGVELAGKTVGLVGLGRVGSLVAARAAGFGMRVIAFDPYVSADRAKEMGVEMMPTLEAVLVQSDFVSIHLPRTPETEGSIGEKELRMIKPGARIVNTARGGIVDEAALAKAIEDGHLGGAALDVFETEPSTDSPLFGLPTVVVTPHLGASTTEAQINVSIEAAQLLVEYFQTGVVKCAVNMASVDATELADVRRFLDIAYRLGLLQSQVHPTVRKATIEYRGEVSKKNTRLVTAAFTMGLLQRNIPDVNLVSARQLAEDRGVRIEERSSSEPSDFAALVQTIVESNAGSYMAAGTTRGASFNRLVRLGPFRLDSYLEGCLLILEHHDQPGIIARTSAILANDKVNIAQMVVGRQRQGGEAVGVLALDSAPSEAAMKELSRMQDEGLVSNLRVVQLPAAGVLPPGVG
jgi:D-3-phosphoglycerate dehydrogenase